MLPTKNNPVQNKDQEQIKHSVPNCQFYTMKSCPSWEMQDTRTSMEHQSYQIQPQNILGLSPNDSLISEKSNSNTESFFRSSYQTEQYGGSKTSMLSKTKFKIIDFDSVTKQLETEADDRFNKNRMKKKKKKCNKLQESENGGKDTLTDKTQAKKQHLNINIDQSIQESIDDRGHLDLEALIANMIADKYCKSQPKQPIKVYQNKLPQLRIPQINSIDSIQTLIGTCFYSEFQQAPPSKKTPKISPKKSKYEININSIILNNTIIIPLSNITKIKVSKYQKQKQQSQPLFEYKLKICYYKSTPSSQSVINLYEKLSVVFIIYSSVITRKLLRLQLQQDETNQNVNYEEQSNYNISPKQVQGTLAVTAYLIGRDSKSYKPADSLKHLTTQNSVIGSKYQISGMIFKKSKHLKKWERRFIQIKDQMLDSFKPEAVQLYDEKNQRCMKLGKNNFKVSKPTYQLKNIDELWTRFQLYHSSAKRKYLIVKTHHYFNLQKIKTEFAIPIVNYANILIQDNWLYPFYLLIGND